METRTCLDGNQVSRRTLLAGAAALPIGAAVGSITAARPASAASGPARLTLPTPRGPYPVGVVALHLVDGPRQRDLMVSVWYPAQNAGRHARMPWVPDAVTPLLLAFNGFAPDVAVAPLTSGRERAPVSPLLGRRPVVLFSHGAHDHRSDTTIIVQELASHGYVVVTVDHTWDAFSQFPDGRVIEPLDDPAYGMGPRDFAADVRFVLDRLEDLAAGHNPDAEHRPLPAGLGRVLDLRRVGMFGWSKGGTATAFVMYADERVRAGLSLDGPMQPEFTTDLDRPFMLMTAVFPRTEPSVAQFWSHLRGWRLNVQADGAVHVAYTDAQTLVAQLAQATGMSDQDRQDWIGTLDPTRAVRIQQAYPLAFFDLHLRGRGGHLLAGPSPAFPEVKFIP